MNGTAGVGASPETFASLAAMRTAQAELLRRYVAERDSLAVIAAADEFLNRGAASGVLFDDEADRWAAQGMLDYWVTVLLRAGRTAVSPALADFDPALAPELPDDQCPYVGLDAFEEKDALRFFGRVRLVEQLLDLVRLHPVVAVIGPSGSGKSSLVRSGLIPKLMLDALPGSAGWRYLPPIFPGSDPLGALARVVMQEPTRRHRAAADIAATLAGGPSAFATLMDEGGRPVVLVIDQFEETFTLCENDATRQFFVSQLLHLVTGRPHRLILTLRSDFETFLARMPGLHALLEPAILRPTPMSAAELREAIEAPAAQIGLKFEAGVVERLLGDTLGEPAALPLLQFTLLKLWERRDHNRVTAEAYATLGGGRLALARSADTFYDALIPQEQIAARRILMRIVRAGSGLEFTSNRVREASLFERAEAAETVRRVLDKLIAAHLVRVTPADKPEDNQVEVAHEALVRNWPRLVEWLEQERQEINNRRRLELRAAEWIRLGSSSAGLLDDAQLGEAERWLGSAAAASLGFDPALQALVDASRRALEQTKAQAERARELELAQAKKLAEAERTRAEQKVAYARRLRVQRRWLIVLLVLSVLALGFFGVSVNRMIEAEGLRARADTELDAAERNLVDARRQAAVAQELARALESGETFRKLAEEKEQLNVALQAKIKELEQTQSRLTAKIAELGQTERERDTARTANTAYERPEEREAKTPAAVLLRGTVRPLRPGVSVGTAPGGTGSLCCIVEDAKGVRYALSMRFVFDKIGQRIVQPGAADKRPSEEIGVVTRLGRDETRSGAAARLDPNVQAVNEVPGRGPLRGTVDSVEPNTTVWFIGRGSGLKEARVLGIQRDYEHPQEDIVLSVPSGPGDAGAPVFTADGRLVGVLWGGDGRKTFVAPIGRIFSELGVSLARSQ